MDIDVKVKTGKSVNKVIKNKFADYEVWVKAPPVKGAANKELIEILANYFNVKKYNLRIVRGLTSSQKVVELKK